MGDGAGRWEGVSLLSKLFALKLNAFLYSNVYNITPSNLAWNVGYTLTLPYHGRKVRVWQCQLSPRVSCCVRNKYDLLRFQVMWDQASFAKEESWSTTVDYQSAVTFHAELHKEALPLRIRMNRKLVERIRYSVNSACSGTGRGAFRELFLGDAAMGASLEKRRTIGIDRLAHIG